MMCFNIHYYSTIQYFQFYPKNGYCEKIPKICLSSQKFTHTVQYLACLSDSNWIMWVFIILYFFTISFSFHTCKYPEIWPSNCNWKNWLLLENWLKWLCENDCDLLNKREKIILKSSTCMWMTNAHEYNLSFWKTSVAKNILGC